MIYLENIYVFLSHIKYTSIFYIFNLATLTSLSNGESNNHVSIVQELSILRTYHLDILIKNLFNILLDLSYPTNEKRKYKVVIE